MFRRSGAELLEDVHAGILYPSFILLVENGNGAQQ